MLPIRRYSSLITEYRAGTGLKATSKNLGEYSKTAAEMSFKNRALVLHMD